MVRITSRSRTIPAAVRKALGVRKGDVVVYLIELDRVIVTRGERLASDGPFALFSAWGGPAERTAYADF